MGRLISFLKRSLIFIVVPLCNPAEGPIVIVAFDLSSFDPQDDIDNGTEALAYLNGITLEASLIYDKSSASITGIALVPNNAPNGTNLLRIKIKDKAGNYGSMEARIASYSVAPVLGLTLKNNTVYLNNRN
jgi:hypothetical protein